MISASSNTTSRAASSVPPEENSFKRALQHEVGPVLTSTAKALRGRANLAIETTISNKAKPLANIPWIGGYLQRGISALGGFAAKAIVNVAIDSEVAVLRVARRVDCVFSRTSPQEIGETLHILTDFLTSYDNAFGRLKNTPFASQEAENTAWRVAMGNSWHPIIDPANQTPEQKQQAFVVYVQNAINRIEKVLFSGNDLLRLPNAQSFTLRAIHYFFDVKINSDFSEQLFKELALRQNIYGSVHSSLEKVISHLKTSGFQFPRKKPIPYHHILVEKVTPFQEVVFHCSERAFAFGIRIGMDKEEAIRVWNDKKSPDEIDALFINEDDINRAGPWLPGTRPSFKGHQPLKAMLKSIIIALFTETSSVICNKVYTIPYIGMPLSVLLKANFWALNACMNLMNKSLQLPSIEVLAEEISTNLLKHLYNRAFAAAPLLIIDHILTILERGLIDEESIPIGPVGPPRPFFGELILGLSTAFKTLCPSLFNHTYPRWAELFASAVLWTAKKTISLTAKVLSLRLTKAVSLYAIRKFSLPDRYYRNKILAEHMFSWIQECSTAFMRQSSSLETIHDVLSSGYRTLGNLGIVSKEQTHFVRGRESFTQLIHEIVIAVSRIFTTKKIEIAETQTRKIRLRHQDFFDKKMAYKILLSKVSANETLIDAELEPLTTRLHRNLEALSQKRTSTQTRLELIGRIPDLTETAAVTEIST